MTTDPLEAAAIAALRARGYDITTPDGAVLPATPPPPPPPPAQVRHDRVRELHGEASLPLDLLVERKERDRALDWAKREIAEAMVRKLSDDGLVTFWTEVDRLTNRVNLRGTLRIVEPMKHSDGSTIESAVAASAHLWRLPAVDYAKVEARALADSSFYGVGSALLPSIRPKWRCAESDTLTKLREGRRDPGLDRGALKSPIFR